MFDTLIFIGRFQPFHRGHLHVVKLALETAKKVVIIAGSDNSASSVRNPLSTSDRLELILLALPEELKSRVVFRAIEDCLHDENKWIAEIRSIANHYAHGDGWSDYPKKVGIVGHNKDNTSYYLNIFPELESVEVLNLENISSTDIREAYYQGNYSGANATKALNGEFDKKYFANERQFKRFCQIMNSKPHLSEEYKYLQKYKKMFEGEIYPRNNVTVDAVVIKAGHILLINRKFTPGKGLLALPGGFLNVDEHIQDGMIRELREETQIDVSDAILKKSIRNVQVFDHPMRSERGRIITHCHLIDLGDYSSLPAVKAADDASQASWRPIDTVISSKESFFEDHAEIICTMLGIK
jgi:bifunctional NMN adenylyltransferase/nudix hydrolase